MENKKIIATIQHADKSFDKRPVLQDVSIELQAGTILGLIGPSGAGKTTTIKCLLGMEKLDKGAAKVFDTLMPNRKILGSIGYMGQSDALYESLSAKENLTFYGSLMGITGKALNQSIEKNMQLVDLQDFTDMLVSNYSGGMKRRLSLATTLLSDPTLLVLDEPTVGIDPKLRVAIWDELRAQAARGKGIIITTHVMEEAEKCDIVGLIIDGRLFAIGSPNELKEKFKADTIEEVFLKAEVNVQ